MVGWAVWLGNVEKQFESTFSSTYEDITKETVRHLESACMHMVVKIRLLQPACHTIMPCSHCTACTVTTRQYALYTYAGHTRVSTLPRVFKNLKP